MRCEILTKVLDRPVLKAELSFLTQYFHNLNHSRCDILVAGAWGLEYYQTEKWDFESIAIIDLCAKVNQLEELGFGQLGSGGDDLYIRFEEMDIEFRFCNDSDIHLDYAQPNQHAEAFFERWQSQGYSPVKWPKNPEERG